MKIGGEKMKGEMKRKIESYRNKRHEEAAANFVVNVKVPEGVNISGGAEFVAFWETKNDEMRKSRGELGARMGEMEEMYAAEAKRVNEAVLAMERCNAEVARMVKDRESVQMVVKRTQKLVRMLQVIDTVLSEKEIELEEKTWRDKVRKVENEIKVKEERQEAQLVALEKQMQAGEEKRSRKAAESVEEGNGGKFFERMMAGASVMYARGK